MNDHTDNSLMLYHMNDHIDNSLVLYNINEFIDVIPHYPSNSWLSYT